jgi:DNA-binding response OmpR family regulator
MNEKILVIDDEINLLQVVKDYLILEQYEVYTSDRGNMAIELFHNLRQKIEDDAKEPRYIVTVYGIGYKFEGE